MAQVEAVHPADHQIRVLEALLAEIVLAVLLAQAVVLAVELDGQTGLLVEQVGDAQQALVPIEGTPRRDERCCLEDRCVEVIGVPAGT